MTRLLRAREYVDADCHCGKSWRGALGTDPTLQCDVCHPEKHGHRPVVLDTSPIITYCAYWGTWSRVLLGFNAVHGVVELNLTPVNPGWPHSWKEQVEPIMFRHHGTSLGRKDEWGRGILPPAVVERMIEHIGPELTNELLTKDWLSLVDLPKLMRGRVGGGGISFGECKK